MQKFEENDPMESQATDAHRQVSYPVKSEGKYVVPTNPWPRNSEKEARDVAGVQMRKPYVHRRQGNDGISMVRPLPQLPQRHTSRVIK